MRWLPRQLTAIVASVSGCWTDSQLGITEYPVLPNPKHALLPWSHRQLRCCKSSALPDFFRMPFSKPKWSNHSYCKGYFWLQACYTWPSEAGSRSMLRTFSFLAFSFSSSSSFSTESWIFFLNCPEVNLRYFLCFPLDVSMHKYVVIFDKLLAKIMMSLVRQLKKVILNVKRLWSKCVIV